MRAIYGALCALLLAAASAVQVSVPPHDDEVSIVRGSPPLMAERTRLFITIQTRARLGHNDRRS